MSAIATWLNQKRQNKMVDRIVDETDSRIRQRDTILDQYFPIRTYNDIDFLAYITKQINTLASVVAIDGEIPNTNQGQLRKLTTELIKIALQRKYTEKLQWQMRKAMKYGGATGVEVQDRKFPDGRIIRGANNTLAEYLFGNVESLVKSVHDTLHLMTWQCIQTGGINYADFRTDITTVIDWRDPDADYDHFPAALTNVGNVVNPETNIWTDYANADGIQLLVDSQNIFEDTTGHSPDAIVMSRRLRDHLLRQESTKDAVQVSLSITNVGTVAPNTLNKILEMRELPPIMTFDEKYEVENEVGQKLKGRFLNQNRFCFLTKNMGERAFGPTIESADGLDGEPKVGIFARTFEKSKSPVCDVTQVIATCLPIVIDPRLSYSQQVTP